MCGRGNNGGDGFVVARTLAQRGVDVSVFLVGATDEVKGDARANLDVLVRLGHSVIEITDAAVWELQFPDIRSGDLLVDALFGTGLRTPLTGLYETIVADINASDLPVVSVDLPSGLSADTPDPIGPCIDATLTVTLGAPKLPLVLPPGEAHCGDVVIADIGIPEAAIEAVEGPAHRAADARAHARAHRAAAGRLAQGRLRPRADRRRLAGQDRRGASGRRWARSSRVRGWSPSPRRARARRCWRRWRRST